MSLLSTFYTITAKEEIASDEFRFHVSLNPQHPIFEGHFPSNPVTPGVVQLEMLKVLVGEIKGSRVNLLKLTNCKYTAILDPNINPSVVFKISITAIAETFKVNAILEDDKIFAKISAVYGI